jgi:hypothetical protein
VRACRGYIAEAHDVADATRPNIAQHRVEGGGVAVDIGNKRKSTPQARHGRRLSGRGVCQAVR